MQPEHRSDGCSKMKRAASAIAAGDGKILVWRNGRLTMQPEHHGTGCSNVKRAASAIAAGGGKILVWRNEELYDAA